MKYINDNAIQKYTLKYCFYTYFCFLFAALDNFDDLEFLVDFALEAE